LPRQGRADPLPREGRLGPKAEHHLVSVVLQVIVQALEAGCTRRDDIVDFVTQRRHSIRPCGEAAAQHAPPSRTPRRPARPALPHAPPAPEPAQGGLQPRPASASLGQSVTGAAPAGHAGPVLTTTCERASFPLTLAPTPTLPPTRHQGQVRPSRSHAEPVPATEAQETEVASGGRRLHADR